MGRRVTTLAVVAILVAGAATQAACTPERDLRPEATIMVGGVAVRVEIADTPQEQETGLQGVKQPAGGAGMLFVWAAPGERTFVIADLRYPVDIVWIDESASVAGISTVGPEGPESATSPGAVVGVLELAAGEAARLGIAKGDVLSASETTGTPGDLPRPKPGETLPSEATRTPATSTP